MGKDKGLSNTIGKMDTIVRFPFNRIRHLLVDLDGVIYRGNVALEPAPRFVAWLRDRHLGFRLVTNNATLTPGQYQVKLAAMGIAVAPEEIFTSSLATALYLRDEGQSGRSAYVIGEHGLRQALAGARIRIVEDRPDWVIVGLDRELTYAMLATAALAINVGARFLGTNPDTSFPSERGLVPGAGSILAALTATTGVQPVVVGKPRPLMLRLAMREMGGSPEDTAMLGDRLDTDIEGAAALDMPSILVLTGVSTRADLPASPVQPDLVVKDLEELMQSWPAPISR
jgi:4-nitrophenyl phosphatase